jgi:hypothetical protein
MEVKNTECASLKTRSGGEYLGMTEEVTGGWRTFHNGKLQNFHSSSNIARFI